MAPNASVTNNTIHTNRLDRSTHIKVEKEIDSKINTPPMVGVPDLLKWA